MNTKGKRRLRDFVEDRILQGKMDDRKIIDTGFFGVSVKKGELVIIGSKPYVGKSALAYSIFRNIGIAGRIPAGVITTGTFSEKELMQRLLSYESGVKYRKLLKGLLKDDDVRKITDAVQKIEASPAFVEDLPNGTFKEIEAAAEIMVSGNHVEIIFIDSFDYQDEVVNGKMSMSELLSQYKNLAQSQNIAVVILMDLPEECNPSSLDVFKKDVAVTRIADAFIFLDREIINDYENHPFMKAKLLYCRDGIFTEHEIFLKDGMCTAGVAGGA